LSGLSPCSCSAAAGEKAHTSKRLQVNSSPRESLSLLSSGSGAEVWPKEKEGSRNSTEEEASLKEVGEAEAAGLEPMWIPDDENQRGRCSCFSPSLQRAGHG
jgi:hypothetical protein